ncbi:MAG TPA: MoaD/ThiS family protein [Anaerolineae bacterium]|nr:MoaD/ThiS family protein [Anaerolineae bacterium]
MPHLTIRLFSMLKDRAGTSRIEIALTEPTRVDALLARIGEQYPALADALPFSAVTINRAYADPDTIINLGDEVALFPPVSGG